MKGNKRTPPAQVKKSPARPAPAKSVAKAAKPLLDPYQEPLNQKWYEKLNFQYVVVAVLAFVLYANSTQNQYALDDVMVITGNNVVKQGISGIGKLISTDSFYGFIGNENDLSGGRWRPLSLVTFALEYEFFKDNTFIKHLINVLLYLLTGVVMLRFVRKHLFNHNLLIPLAVTAIWLLHPLHSEVVANIKSRDEILSWLFIILSMHYGLDYLKFDNRGRVLAKATACMALALLAKENALMFAAILPITFYCFAPHLDLKESFRKTIPYYVVILAYLLIRWSIVAKNTDAVITEVTNAYYLYATPVQKFATKIYVLGMYFKLLFVPYPLSCDYSYAQIPYTDFSDPLVWLTILIYGFMVVYGFLRIQKRDLLAYCFLFYLFSIFIVSNFVMDIGAAIGERFTYQGSFAWAIAVGYYLIKFSEWNKAPKFLRFGLTTVFSLFVVSSFGYISMERSRDWKNNDALFLNDIQVTGGSSKTNMATGITYLNLEANTKNPYEKKIYIKKGIDYLSKALIIHPIYVDAYVNLGICYSRINNIDSAEYCWTRCYELNPRHPKTQEITRALCNIHLNKAILLGQKREFNKGIGELYTALKFNNSSPEAWYNLGGVYYTIARYDSSAICFSAAYRLNPALKDAQKGYEASVFMQKQQAMRNLSQGAPATK